MNMSRLEPVPIRTKGQSFLARVWALLTVTRKWAVIENWFFTLPNGVKIVVPAGFIFDGASIPKPLWFLLSPIDLVFIAGLIHDFAYRYGYLWAIASDGRYYRYRFKNGSRLDYDQLFRDVNVQVNGMIYTDYIAASLLKLFGSIAWNKKSKLDDGEIMPG